jgi:hypothetical protein
MFRPWSRSWSALYKNTEWSHISGWIIYCFCVGLTMTLNMTYFWNMISDWRIKQTEYFESLEGRWRGKRVISKGRETGTLHRTVSLSFSLSLSVSLSLSLSVILHAVPEMLAMSQQEQLFEQKVTFQDIQLAVNVHIVYLQQLIPNLRYEPGRLGVRKQKLNNGGKRQVRQQCKIR